MPWPAANAHAPSRDGTGAEVGRPVSVAAAGLMALSTAAPARPPTGNGAMVGNGAMLGSGAIGGNGAMLGSGAIGGMVIGGMGAKAGAPCGPSWVGAAVWVPLSSPVR